MIMLNFVFHFCSCSEINYFNWYFTCNDAAVFFQKYNVLEFYISMDDFKGMNVIKGTKSLPDDICCDDL